jgi:hypothetical protein
MQNSTRPKTGRRYEPLTRLFARWLYQYIDRYDCGVRARDGHPVYFTDNVHLSLFRDRSYWPQKLTQTLIQRHLHGDEKLYLTSSRSSGFALIRLDIDAHHGQTDALDAADWITATFFPEAYHEPSQRGHGIYLVVQIERCRRCRFNDLLIRLNACLSALMVENGFQSTLEIQGGFTIFGEGADGSAVVKSRGKLAAMPRLPNRESDLHRLKGAPIFTLKSIFDVFDAYQLHRDTQASSAPVPSVVTLLPQSDVAPLKSPDAWDRMKRARFHFTTLYRRDPDLEELLRHYQAIYKTDVGDARRIRRAVYALRCSTFDISASTLGGYESNRQRLLEMVESRETSERCHWRQEITSEDLAIYLYSVESRSFSIADAPRLQFTCNYDFVATMFTALKAVTHRGGSNRNKLKAIRDVLESAGLIECNNRGYVPTGKKSGICQKWVVGPRHPRYAEWRAFASAMMSETAPRSWAPDNVTAASSATLAA